MSSLSKSDETSSNQALQPTAGRSDVQFSDDFSIKLCGKARSRQRWLSFVSLDLMRATVIAVVTIALGAVAADSGVPAAIEKLADSPSRVVVLARPE